MSCAALCLAALLPGPAVGLPPAPPADREEAQFVEKPDGDAFARYYPWLAAVFQMEGKARLHCIVAADGTLEACRVMTDEPAGYRFGEAALRIAPSFRVTTAAADGTSFVGTPFTTTIKFRLPGPAPASRLPVEPADPAALPDVEQLVPKAEGAADTLVFLSCRPARARALRDCRVEAEATTPGIDWRPAALALAGRLRATPGAVLEKGRVRFALGLMRSKGGEPGMMVAGPPGHGPVEVAPGHESVLALVSALYPPRAWQARAGGTVRVVCEIGPDRSLTRCGSTRDDWGFYKAVQSLAPYLRAKDGPDAPPAGAPVSFLVHFMIGRDGSDPQVVIN